MLLFCAWLCFDSSPCAHCQHYCLPALLVSLLISSSCFTPGSRYLFSYPFIAPCVSLSFVRLLWLLPFALTVVVCIAYLSCLVSFRLQCSLLLVCFPALPVRSVTRGLPPASTVPGSLQTRWWTRISELPWLASFPLPFAACSSCCYPPICVIVDSTSTQTVYGSAYHLFRLYSVK